MAEILKPLVGKKVTVYTLVGGGQDRQDVGTLEQVEGNWLQIRKGDSDVLFFPVANVRLVKPFEPL